MLKSELVNDLFGAISKAQGEFTSVKFDKVNPFFNNSKYASLSATQEMYRSILSKHGLGLIQSVTVEGEDYFLETMLLHSSGQFLSDKIKLLIDRKNMQGLGSAITYAKRYAAQSMLGICGDEDDDGNGSSTVQKEVVKKPQPQVQPLPTPIKKDSKPVSTNTQATTYQYNLIRSLLEVRGIPHGDIDFLVTQGYAASPERLPQWVAKEIIDLLSDTETNQSTIVKKTGEVKERRLNAASKKV